jgi:ribulose-5-phosphate 4-epimerase/fuculose-1-phosphate aldolase
LPASAAALVSTLDGWRRQLWRERLIGHDGVRYGGVGWGNVSARVQGQSFLITGTQTGGLEHTDERHYALVEASEGSSQHGVVRSRGPLAPSSEAMSHASVYAAMATTGFVFHVHAPELWRAAGRLGLPSTPDGVEYGTVAMAEAVAELVQRVGAAGVLAMAGHEDGIIAWGPSAQGVGEALLGAYEAAKLGR